MSGSAPAHRVLLVREWDQQTTGASCCGRLEGGDAAFAGAADFGRARLGMEQMGAVYRALVAELPRDRVDVQVVDPRNVTFLVPGVLRDARRRGLGWWRALDQVRRGVGQGTIVVDGVVVSSGPIPPPDVAVDLVLRALAPSAA